MRRWFVSLRGKCTCRPAIPAPPTDVISDLDAGRSIPDDLVDAFLDGDIPVERHSALFSTLRRLPDAHMRLDETEQAIDALKVTPGAPDLTGRILTEVHRRRGLLERDGLRRVSVARWSLAACVLIASGLYFTARRAAPEQTSLVAAPAPIHDLTSTLPVDSSFALIAAQSALEPMRQINSELAVVRACAAEEVAACSRPCPSRCVTMLTIPVLDSRLFVASWLDSVTDSALFARTAAPSRQAGLRTMSASWTPPAATPGFEAPAITVRSLFLEPGRQGDSTEADRLFVAPRR